MPRIGRAILQYYPHHVVQRGHNRQVVFAEARDNERYLETLAQFKDVYGVKVYAFCLMTNHVHMLVAPEEIAGLGQLMKRLAGRQTRYHNRLEGRTGTLWESRYKSSPVDTDDYLLACTRYIELNPVRARMVATPEDYRWSSCHYHLGRNGWDWLDPDPCYLALGNDEIHFSSRFSGVSQDLLIPMHAVATVFAKENGQGLVFPKEAHAPQKNPATHAGKTAGSGHGAAKSGPKRGKPSLQVVK